MGKAARIATTRYARPTAMGKMACATESLVSASATHSKTPTTAMPSPADTMARCAKIQFARTSIWLTGRVQWINGVGQSAKRDIFSLVSSAMVSETLSTIWPMVSASSQLKALDLTHEEFLQIHAIMRTGGRSLTAREGSFAGEATLSRASSEATATRYTALKWQSAAV